MKVKTPVSLIGASEQAELRMDADNIPEAMAMILRIGQGYWLWNLEPAFSCRVNGEVVVRMGLGEGSVISIVGKEFRFHVRPETAAVLEAKEPDKRAARSPARPKRASTAPAPRKTPTATPAPDPAAPPISTPPSIAKPDLVAKLPVPSPPATPPRAAAQPAVPMIPPASAAARAPEEEADVFKQWGPLAFAVAAADRPELQGGGSKSSTSTLNATALPAPSKPPGSRLAIGTLSLLAILTAGAYLAWKYLILPARS
jgi:hypothetical protein